MRKVAGLMLLGLVLAWSGGAAMGGETYTIDQRFGGIAFTVRHLGLFSSEGAFRRFSGQLTIDEVHPENTRIAVVIDTNSIAMDWAEATAMLRSASYFDVQRYPDARFTSSRVVLTAPGHYDVEGQLEIRGITQPLLLHAALVGRHPADQPGAEIAEFVVTGELQRSRFGMTADKTFVSDRVDLKINARVRLEEGAHAG